METRVTELAEVLENRLAKLSRRLSELVEELAEPLGLGQGSAGQLDNLRTAQTAARRAAEAASQPS